MKISMDTFHLETVAGDTNSPSTRKKSSFPKELQLPENTHAFVLILVAISATISEIPPPNGGTIRQCDTPLNVRLSPVESQYFDDLVLRS
ncbi:hypothetical protein TNIN_459521 [Trichonephila inaurata madagascariensis]|uniref:Uncharacterized protein n=1 Tax=Trichonephila inaurata madagascariensis TaxID=2747483 RepID=A0A8X7C717_9ARAC|nr:hypothetical protein TNIN_459521 [Trichonephila inaurata madagascariensis]